MNDQSLYQWSAKQDNGEIWLVRADSQEDLLAKVNALREKIGVPPSKFTQPPADVNPKYAPVRTELKSIEVESIEFAGKERWIIKGKPFVKYGITCFEEVLERAGILDKLNMKAPTVPQKKWLAWYQEKQKDDGSFAPDKVLELKLAE